MAKQKYVPRVRGTDHIHTPRDGRGFRDVYVNGGLVKKAFYADTRKGVVRHYLTPLRLNKSRDCAATRTKRGKVTIKWHKTTSALASQA